MGLLIAEGTIDLQQFWPSGESDADTTKVGVNRFLYSASGEEAQAKRTHALDRSVVHGRVTKSVLDAKGRITVRYQGIDAPELHYRAMSEIADDDPAAAKKKAAFHVVNKRYRQHCGETAVAALAGYLGKLAKSWRTIDCRVLTRVNHPNDVFDTYGRFVGNVIVRDNDINLWLVRHGFAFPTFYSSMEPDEINALLEAAKKARSGHGSIVWTNLVSDTRLFDWNLTYAKDANGGAVTNDGRELVFPKIFRRLAAYRTNHRAKIFSGGFRSFLEKRRRDVCFDTKEFLAQGVSAATPKRLCELVEGSTFVAEPEELVFQEAASTLVDASGRNVSVWFSA